MSDGLPLEVFLKSFLAPLVAGGELVIGPPFRPSDLERWELELGVLGDSDETDRIAAARARVARLILPRAERIELSVDDLRLAVVLHAAMALAHPEVAGWSFSRARKRIVSACRRMLGTVAPATDRATLVARHSLLARLAEVERIDTRVAWWTGSATFRGQAPPPRLLRWQAVRRVRQQRVPQALDEVLTDDGRMLVAGVLRTSPLTALLRAAELAPLLALDWRGAEGVLRDQELARAVAYEWLGDHGGDATVRRLTLAARAWAEAIGRVPSDVLKTVTAFLVHLGGLVALGESGMTELDGPSALVAKVVAAEAPVSVGLREATTPTPSGPSKQLPPAPPIASGGALFFLVPTLVGEVAPALAMPPGLADDAKSARRWAAHRAQVKEQGGIDEGRLASLQASLRAALG
jgi:hypothetical protein